MKAREQFDYNVWFKAMFLQHRVESEHIISDKIINLAITGRSDFLGSILNFWIMNIIMIYFSKTDKTLNSISPKKNFFFLVANGEKTNFILKNHIKSTL